MSYVYQEYPKWVRAQGVRSRIVANEAEERAFYESLPPIHVEPADAPPPVAADAVTVSVDVPEPSDAPKRRGRPPKAKVSE